MVSRSYHKDGSRKVPTTALCSFVNQLNTARRFMKTDRVDARTIAAMLLSDAGLKLYTDTAYQNEELTSLARYCFDKVKERARLKTSVSRLVCILFPELENMVSTLHATSIYALLEEFPGAKQNADAHLTKLKTLLADASRGHYERDVAVEIRDTAKCLIGSRMPAKSMELQHTIRLIRELDAKIKEIEAAIQVIMDEIHSPITTIPGIGCRMGAMILFKRCSGSIWAEHCFLFCAPKK